jgi:porin
VRQLCCGGVQLCTAALLLAASEAILCAAEFASGGVAAQPAPVATGGAFNVVGPQPVSEAPRRAETRSQLTGNWFGARSALAENGLTFFGDVTQYYQGVTAGGLSRRFEYGGRGDYLIDIDSQRLGLWQGGRFDLRGETRLGQDVNRIDGAVAPANFAMALPLPNRNVTALTGVQFSQDLSERLTVFAGKLNLLDGTPASYAQGRRLNYFWNTAMQNNLSRIFLLPSTLGGGFTLRDAAEPVFSFYLLDTHFTPTTSGFSTLFSNGIVAYGEYRLQTEWLGRPGHSAVGLLYSDANRTALDGNPYETIGGIVSGTLVPTKSNAWTATYRFDQVVWADSRDPSRQWVLNSDFGLTDGNPNPIHWFANVSLVGNSPIRDRPNDTIGIGYYHLRVSTLPVLKALGLFAENGVELFYNIAVTPWFHITPDVQVLDPARSSTATALLVGVRGRVSF